MKKNIIIIILSILVLGMGAYLFFDKVIDKDEKTEVKEGKIEQEEINHQEENNEVVTKELKNFDLNSIKNIEVTIPVLGVSDPEMNSVIIEDKKEIEEVLLNIDNKEEVGAMETVGFISNVTITINYEGDPSTEIIVLDNGNIAINSAVGAGETGYAEYKIENKNLASELTNKYQVKE